jgi:hypothetical protein
MLLKAFVIQNKIFVLCTLLFSFWYIDVWENSNSCSRVLPIATYFEQGNFVLDKYKDKTIDISVIEGHYYMDKAPLPTIITLPFFGLIKQLGIVKSIDGSYYGKAIYMTGAIICGIIPFLLILFYVAKSLIERQRKDLILMAFVAYFSSFIFVFAGTFFANVLAASFMLMAYTHYQKKKYYIAGLLCGLGFLTEYTTLWIVFSWLLIELFKYKSIKTSMQIALGFLPALLIILSYNFYFTGSPFKMLYLFVADNFDVASKSTYGLSFPKLKALYGLIISENRGLLFYAPVLIYGLFLFFTQNGWLSKFKNYLLHPIILPFILTTLFISSHAAWDGGWSYGPRHLTAVGTLLIFGFIQSDLFGQYKSVFWVTCGYGLICTLLAKLTVIYSVPPLEENILTYLLSKLKDGFNDGNVLSLLTQQKALHAFYIFLLFLIGMFLMKPINSNKITAQ